jgi:hypothetical protein
MALKLEGYIELSYEEWLALPPAPWQRNTEEQARKARKKHFSDKRFKLELSRRVDVYEDLNTGKLYRADGHSRKSLWEAGTLPHPETLMAAYYTGHGMEDFKDLYGSIDCHSASKSTKHILQGALSCVDYGCRSTFVGNGDFLTALRIASASHGLDYINVCEDVVLSWMDEIATMDQMQLPRKARGWRSEVFAAVLLSLRHYGLTERHGRSVVQFWYLLANNMGYKVRGKMCPVNAAYEAMMRYNTKKPVNLCGILMSCIVAFMKGNEYEQAPRPSTIERFRKARKDKYLPNWETLNLSYPPTLPEGY